MDPPSLDTQNERKRCCGASESDVFSFSDSKCEYRFGWTAENGGNEEHSIFEFANLKLRAKWMKWNMYII
jgi:hypothetical protein